MKTFNEFISDDSVNEIFGWSKAEKEEKEKLENEKKEAMKKQLKMIMRAKNLKAQKQLLKKEVYEIGTDEYREYLEDLTPGQSKKKKLKEINKIK